MSIGLTNALGIDDFESAGLEAHSSARIRLPPVGKSSGGSYVEIRALTQVGTGLIKPDLLGIDFVHAVSLYSGTDKINLVLMVKVRTAADACGVSGGSV
ncbi:hypothetical protein GCM10027402_22580 [Arthrobacter monumenti]